MRTKFANPGHKLMYTGSLEPEQSIDKISSLHERRGIDVHGDSTCTQCGRHSPPGHPLMRRARQKRQGLPARTFMQIDN